MDKAEVAAKLAEVKAQLGQLAAELEITCCKVVLLEEFEVAMK